MKQSNIFNKERIVKRGISEYSKKSNNELEELLSNKSGYIRSRVLIEFASRGILKYAFEELTKDENQELNALFGVTVSQIIGLIIIDYGNMSEIKEMRELINEWADKQQIEDFVNYVKGGGIDLNQFLRV